MKVIITIFYSLIILSLINNCLAKETKNNKISKEITLQLQWKHQFQFAGYYIAKEKGFYKNNGLKVNIKELEQNTALVDDLIKGKYEFAIGRSSLIVNKSYGDEITLLSAIFQASPDVLVALKDSQIYTISDFKNKKIMITGDAKNDLVYKSMLFSQNMSISNMQILKHTFNIEDLVNKKTDLMASYISNEPFRLKEEYSLDSVIFDPKDYGFDFYGDILFTSNHLVQKDPILVKKFKEASLKGWKYAFENIEETVNLILKKYNTQNKSKKALLFEANELKKLAYYNTNKLGKIDFNKIQRIYDAYKLIGIANKSASLNNFIFDDFKAVLNLTKEEKNYLKNKNEIHLCIDPNWMPYEKFDEQGKHIGLSSDYFNLFEKKLNTKITPIKTQTWTQTLKYMKKRKCDVLSLAMETKSRKEYINFTPTFLQMPLVFATKLNVTFIDNFKQLKKKKIAIVKDYAYSEIIKNKYPNLMLIEVKNTKEGLNKVFNEEVFGFIGSVADISFITQNHFLAEIKIAGKFEEKLNLSIGIRKDDEILYSIFNKLVKSIPINIKDEIRDKHLAITYVQKKDYTLFWKSTIIFITILLLGLYWMLTIKKEKKKTELLLYKLQVTQKQIKDKNKELKILASTDKLTNLFNRVKLDSTLIKEIQRAKRYDHPFGIIIIDIDDFKVVNDTYGHLVGDEVLINLADILKKHTRKIDIVGRWGGEEFLIICPETNIEGVRQLSNTLRSEIELHSFKKVHTITASFGIAQFKITDTCDSLILKADKALYNAKRDGKNCVRDVLNN